MYRAFRPRLEAMVTANGGHFRNRQAEVICSHSVASAMLYTIYLVIFTLTLLNLEKVQGLLSPLYMRLKWGITIPPFCKSEGILCIQTSLMSGVWLSLIKAPSSTFISFMSKGDNRISRRDQLKPLVTPLQYPLWLFSLHSLASCSLLSTWLLCNSLVSFFPDLTGLLYEGLIYLSEVSCFRESYSSVHQMSRFRISRTFGQVDVFQKHTSFSKQRTLWYSHIYGNHSGNPASVNFWPIRP